MSEPEANFLDQVHGICRRDPRYRPEAYLFVYEALGFTVKVVAKGEHRQVRGRERLSRGEWRQLLDAIRCKTWVRRGSIVRGFGGLEGKQALLAYLESRAVIELIEERHPGAIARWLTRCADGEAWEPALEAETGWDTLALERELIQAVRARFPADPLGGVQLGEEEPSSPPEPSSRNRPGSPASTPSDDRRAASRAAARAPA